MGGRLLIATLLDESIQPYPQQVLSFAVPFTSLSNQTNTQSTAVGKLCCAFHQPQTNTQSTAGVKFCCSFYQPQHHVQKCWAKTILLRHVLTFLRSIFFHKATYWVWVALLLVLNFTFQLPCQPTPHRIILKVSKTGVQFWTKMKSRDENGAQEKKRRTINWFSHLKWFSHKFHQQFWICITCSFIAAHILH